MAPQPRVAGHSGPPIEGIDRLDGSIWCIKLLRQVNQSTWFIRWVMDGVKDSSVFDQEMSAADMRPESVGCSHNDCTDGRLQVGVPVLGFTILPPGLKRDQAVVSHAWYDGVIVKAERRSHIHLRRGTAGTYGECQCFYTIRFRPAVDTSKHEAPTFVKRIMGTRRLAFRSFARGSIFDIISGRIRREDLGQSWRPEYRIDVSRFALDTCINVPPRTSVQSKELRASPSSTGQPDSHFSTAAQEKLGTPQGTKTGPQVMESPLAEWLRIKRESWERAAARGATTDAGLGEAPHGVDALSSPREMVDSGPGLRTSEGGFVSDKDPTPFVSLPSPETEAESGPEWAKGFSQTLSESEKDSDVEMTEATAHVDSILDSGVLEGEAGFGGFGMESPDLDDEDFDIDVGTEVVMGGVQGLGGPPASEGCQLATWLRCESESADEGQLSPLEEERALSREGEKRIGKGARKRKFDGKETEGSKKRDRKAISSAGLQPDLVLSGDKWAELEEAEERAEAAQKEDAGAGVWGSGRRSLRLLTGLSTQLGGGKTRGSHAGKERTAKKEDQDKIGKAKQKDKNKVRETKKGSGTGETGGKGGTGSKKKKAPEVDRQKKEYVWSSDDEEAAKPRTSGSEGNGYQDAITTAWEQLQGYNADQIMKGALTKETKEEPGLKGLGRDCERQSHPLRQEQDGMYCAECRCFVRQLTETDLRPAKPATDNKACFEQAFVEKKASKQLRKKGVGKKRLKRFEGEPNAALKGEETAGKKAEESLETPESLSGHAGEKFLREQMLRHQKDALEFITRALVGDPESGRKEGGAILWHSPGLGKTLVALAVIQHLRCRLRYAERLWPIIIAPASIQENWVREITKWFTGKPGRPRRMEVYRVDEPSIKHTEALERVERKLKRKAAREKAAARDGSDFRTVDFDSTELEALEELALNEKRLKTVRTWKDMKNGPLIISYQLLRTIVGGFGVRAAAAPEARAQEELAKLILEVPNLVVMDEGHLNRNPGTQTFQVLGRLKTQRRLMLTGTLINNNLEEVYHMARFVSAHNVLQWAESWTSVAKRKESQSAAPHGNEKAPSESKLKEASGRVARLSNATEDMKRSGPTACLDGFADFTAVQGPSKGTSAKASSVKETFQRVVGRPIDRWISGTGPVPELRAEAEDALRELTELIDPFVHTPDEDEGTLHQQLRIPERKEYVVVVKMGGTARELYNSFVDSVIGRRAYEERIKKRRTLLDGSHKHPPAEKEKRRPQKKESARISERNEEWEENGEMDTGALEISDDDDGGTVPRGKEPIGQEKDLTHICAHPAAFFRKAMSKHNTYKHKLDRFRREYAGPVDPAHSGKLQFVLDLLRACKALEEGGGTAEKVIVFSDYRKPLEVFIDGVKAALRWEDGHDIVYVHGGVGKETRMKMVDSFQSEGGPRVLFATIGACGHGLNMYAATRVVFLEPNWNPQNILQALHRAHRIGQTRPLYVYRLVCENTYEERVIYLTSLEKDRLGTIVAQRFRECARACAEASACIQKNPTDLTGSQENEGVREVKAEGTADGRKTETGLVDEITDQFLRGFLETWGDDLVAEARDYRQLVSCRFSDG